MSWHFSNRLIQDFENSHSSQVLGEASLGANCLAGELSVPLSGTLMHGTFWSPDKTMDVLKPSRSGMTYRHSTADHGEAVLTWFLEASPARTSPAPEKEQESTVNEVVYGLISQESLAKFDLNSSLWKTPQQSLFVDLEESLAIFPDWGSMQNGELFPQKMSAALKSAEDFGRLRHSIQEQQQSEQMKAGVASGATEMFFLDANVTTQSGSVMNAESGPTRFIMKNGTVALTAVPKMWLTPQANEDAAGTPNGNMQRMLGNHPLIRGTTPEQWKSGTLNPTWIEWLMGFPLGWTDCDVLATAKFRQWQHSHGIF
jgi:hypothetical protein